MNNKCKIGVLLLALIFAFGTAILPAAQNAKGSGQRLAKTASDNDQKPFDVNRIYSYLQNNGHLVENQGNNAGMYWPSLASGSTINFASGVWVAGKVNGVAVTACAEYDAGEWAAGKVLPNGEPANQNDPKYRIYKINKADALNPQGNIDWMEWPVDDGAPWIDANSNGVYEPLLGDAPNLIGDQMFWYVMNDLVVSKHDNVFSSQPLGLECRVTIWGYNRSDEFGDMMFAKFDLYNKRTTTVDSCYLGIWADVDLGDGGDDFVGCVPELGLGYTYNDGADGVYGDGCPALGYDFFQGAIVASPGDTAKSFGTMIPDYKNLGMNSFNKYIRGDDDYPDPETAQEAWNYMAGMRYDGNSFIDPTTNLEVKPVLYGTGDPVLGTGWLDATDHPSGDRRQLQSCGPFTLSPGDSQEVVTAMIVAQGTSSLSSITRLKTADIKAQTAYNLDFQLPQAPPAPVVKTSGMDGSILLTWDGAAEDYNAIDRVDIDESGDPSYYTFQGYNIYQLEGDQGFGVIKKIATYDLKDVIQNIKDREFVSSLGEIVEHTVQDGKDTGVRRFHFMLKDELRGVPLVNNRPYYFAVTAYGYNPLGVPRTMESTKNVLTVYPQEVFGKQASDGITVGDDSTIVATHTGPSQGSVSINVINPLELTGHDYQVKFYDLDGETAWKLIDVTAGTEVLKDQVHQGSDSAFTVVDGMLVSVAGPAQGMLACVEVANPTYNPLPNAQMDASGRPYGGNNVWHSYSCPDDANQTGQFIFGSQANAYLGDLSRAHDYEIRWTANGSWANFGLSTGTWVKVPFEIWDIGFSTPNDPSDDEQMVAVLYEGDNGTADVWDIPNGVEVDDYLEAPCSDRIYMYYVDQEGKKYADMAAACDAGNFSTADAMWGNVYARPFGRLVIIYYGGETGDPKTGTVVRFLTNKPNSTADEFNFTTAGYQPRSSDDLAKLDVQKINVYPNPYFGANVEEIKTLEHFVRFTHLPPTATIRIFTLAGEPVRTIQHTDGTQYEKWDMLNNFNVPVASGIYIAHVDCGKLGQKVLKLALITVEERLRQY